MTIAKITLYDDWLDARDFASLQLAIDAALAQDKPLRVVGTYDIYETIVIRDRGLRMYGQSLANLGKTILRWHGDGPMIRGHGSDMPQYGGVYWGGMIWHGIHCESAYGNESTAPLVDFAGMINARFTLCRFNTRGRTARAALCLGAMCIGNVFDQCSFMGSDGQPGLLLEGYQHHAPNLNRFHDCDFTGDGTTKLANGIELICASTNVFNACQAEGLNTGFIVRRSADGVEHSRQNIFGVRGENCNRLFDWTDNGAYNAVVWPYRILNGPDVGDNLHLVLGTEFDISRLARLDLVDYAARPALRIVSKDPASGVSWHNNYPDTPNSTGLRIHTDVGRDAFIRPNRNLTIDSVIGGTLATNMPLALAVNPVNPANRTIYIKTEAGQPDKVIYKDGTGQEKQFKFEE